MEALILSYALDTNGQNARFVRASERFGADKDVLQVLALGKIDPAGVVGRYKVAADKGAKLRIRSVHRTQTYMDFPADLSWNRHTEREIRELADRADVIHLNNSYRAANRLRITRKPVLLHHHGSLFRNNTAHMLEVARHRRWTQAVSTLDLTRPAPDVLHWLPTAYDIDWLQAFRAEHRKRDDDRIRIVHCPTNREYKATEVLIAAVKQLQADGLPVDLDLVEGVTWMECLERKAQADILFDQLAWGYGCNAVEAWGMGIPVVAGADDWTLDRMEQEFGTLPFHLANAHNLYHEIDRLVRVPVLMAEYADIGLAHVRKYHDEKPALARLAELYTMTIDYADVPRHRTAAEAVRFRSVGRPRTVGLGDERVTVTQDGVEVTDPDLIIRLRGFAEKRPSYGIVEEKAEGAA